MLIVSSINPQDKKFKFATTDDGDRIIVFPDGKWEKPRAITDIAGNYTITSSQWTELIGSKFIITKKTNDFRVQLLTQGCSRMDKPLVFTDNRFLTDNDCGDSVSIRFVENKAVIEICRVTCLTSIAEKK